MRCPACTTELTAASEPTPYGRVELDFCSRCRGVWCDPMELAGLLQSGNLALFAAESPLLEGARPSLACPRHPDSQMRERSLRAPAAPDGPAALKLDQCSQCEGVWLDGGELKQVAAAMQSPAAAEFLEDPERQRLGAGIWVFQFLTGLPIEQWNPRMRRPVVVYALVAACVCAFGLEIAGDPERVVHQLGLVPAHIAAVPLLAHMFLHGGLAHLLGNLYFLWVFGDNVEDRLGRARFLLLYFASGLVAGLTHALLASDPDVPVVGASGAIAGVMAAYAVLFPGTRVIQLILFWRVRWRAWIYLGIWLGFQIVGVAMGAPGIAWWAHIGGFAAGAALALLMRPPRALAVANAPAAAPARAA